MLKFHSFIRLATILWKPTRWDASGPYSLFKKYSYDLFCFTPKTLALKEIQLNKDILSPFYMPGSVWSSNIKDHVESSWQLWQLIVQAHTNGTWWKPPSFDLQICFLPFPLCCSFLSKVCTSPHPWLAQSKAGSESSSVHPSKSLTQWRTAVSPSGQYHPHWTFVRTVPPWLPWPLNLTPVCLYLAYLQKECEE